MGYLKRPIRRSRARLEANALREVAPIDPANWTRYQDDGDWPKFPYLRFMIEHDNWKGRRGLFRGAGEVCDFDEQSATLRKRISTALRWFNRHLPVPRARDIPPRTTFWFVNASDELHQRLGCLNAALIEAGCRVFLSVTDNPGAIYFRDQYQVAAVRFRDREDPASETERIDDSTNDD